MATLNSLSVVLTGNASQLSSVLTRSAAEIRAFGKEASTAGAGGSIALKAIGGAAAVAGIGIAYAATQAAEFQKAMLNVTTIDASVKNSLGQVSAQVLDLSTHLPQSAKELASGLYDISSSGFQGAQSLSILKVSATAASAGLSTTANAAKAITATLNAYGLKATDAKRVSDALFQTVNFGVVDFDQLTAVIGDTVGTAAAAGINIEQLGAAIATLTLSGLSASEAGTSLNRVLTSLIKPNTALLEAQKHLGVSFTQELRDPAIGLKGVLDQLLKSVGGNRTAFSNLFTDIRASRGVLALEAAGGQNYTRVLEQMGVASDNTGATQKALAQQAKGVSFQLTLLKNQFNAAAITVGEKLLPALTTLIGAAGRAGQAIGHDLVVAAAALRPLLSDLVGIGNDLGRSFIELEQTVGPLAADLAKIAGGAVVVALNGIGDAVKATTGFLADDRTAVIALVVAFGLLKYEAIAAGFTTVGIALKGIAIQASFAADTAVTSLARFGGAMEASQLAAVREAAAVDAAAAATARLAAEAAIAATAIKEEVQGELFLTSSTGELLSVTNAAAASQLELTLALNGTLNAYTESEAAAVLYAESLQLEATAATEAAAASDLAAASAVGLGRGFATGLLKGGVVVAGVIGIAYAIDQITSHAKEALPAVQDLTNAFSQGDEAAKIKAFVDSLSGSSSGDNRHESVLEFLQRYKINLDGLFQAVSTGDISTVDKVILKIGQLGNVQGDTNSKVQGSARISTTTYSQIQKVLEDLTHQYGSTSTAVKALSAALAGIPFKTEAQIQADKAYAAAEKELGVALKQNNPITLNLASAHVQLAKAQQNAAGSLKDYQSAQRIFNSDGQAINKTLSSQIDFFKGVQDQSDITAATLLKNAQDTVNAFSNEATNITKLSQAGLRTDLIKGLFDQGPQAVAAIANASPQLQQQYQKLFIQSIQGKQRAGTAVNAAVNPQQAIDVFLKGLASNKATQDAFSAGITSQVSTAISGAQKLLDSFSKNVNPSIADKVGANQKLALQAFLNSLPVPIREAVAQALPILESGASDVTKRITLALVSARPAAASESLKLIEAIQGNLNLLKPKQVQVILDDLASGKVPNILDALAKLQQAILNLPAGVALGIPQDPLTSVLAPPKKARGGFSGPVRGGTSMRADNRLIAVSDYEYVVQGPAAMKYGGAVMDSVNRGTAEIIPHFAGGGQVGNFYQTNLTTAPLASSLEKYAAAVAQQIAQANQITTEASAAIGSTGGGAARWAPLVLKALGMEGLPTSLLSRVLAQINLESGGNPNAINLWDSNAAKGQPSQGLLQTVPGTFSAYHWPGTSSNIDDPYANIAAAINYGAHRYGAGTLGMGFGHGYARGGPVGFATGGPVNPAVAAYLTALAKQQQVSNYLNALATANHKSPAGVGVLKFLADATKLAPGVHDLAVRGLQDAYGMPTRNSTWDQATTDFLAVNTPHVGAQSAAIKFLQLAIKRPATGRLTAADLPNLGRTVNAAGFSGGDTSYGALIHSDANQTLFQTYLQTIIRRGFSPLAAYLNQQGADQALVGARQLAGAPIATLQRANAAAVRQSTTSKFGDALNLAQQLASYGGKVGLLGLASRSGTSVADALGLITSFPDVFSAVGSSARLLTEDLKRIAAGQQPVAAYAGGAWEIKRDHVATVHAGETIQPAQYAEPWRRHMAAGGTGGGISIVFPENAIPVTVGDNVNMGQVRAAVRDGINDGLGQVVTKIRAGAGRRG